jgi:hypothetical protein
MLDPMTARRTRARAAPANPRLDRVFEGGCTLLFLTLLAAVARSVWPYL